MTKYETESQDVRLIPDYYPSINLRSIAQALTHECVMRKLQNKNTEVSKMTFDPESGIEVSFNDNTSVICYLTKNPPVLPMKITMEMEV
jgi:hypothetical protein